MNRFGPALIVVLSLILAAGCSSGGGNVISPALQVDYDLVASSQGDNQTHLWGYFDIYIDVETWTVEAVSKRDAMFTANVVNFLNMKPTNLSFKINGITSGADYTDVDIDVTISHPFPGLPQYNGYDVRGVFMGDGSGQLEWNSSLFYPVMGTDQFMLTNPDEPGSYGGPDGYTRWFNAEEFSEGGLPMVQYTPGKVATPGYIGTSVLNPYKYYADGLEVGDDLWPWLNVNADDVGQFSSGATNTRNYYLRFPNGTGVKYAYAVLASWDDVVVPSNAPEAVACDVDDSSNVWFVNPTTFGGSLLLDISLFNWYGQPSAIAIESSVLSGVYQLDSEEMTPVGGGDNYSTWEVEIGADEVKYLDGNEYWVIAEYDAYDYKNDFGGGNLADDDPLTAFFRFDLNISDTPTNLDPVCDLAIDDETPLPVEDFWPIEVKFDATGSYDSDGDPLTFEWDFDGDGIYDEDPDDSYSGDPDNPTHAYYAEPAGDVSLRLTDGVGGESICSVGVEMTGHESKNIPLRGTIEAIDVGVDENNSDLWICYGDRQVYKYTLGGWYDDPAYKYSVGSTGSTITMMDTTVGGFSHFMTTHPTYSPTEYIYNSSGGVTMGMGWGGADNHFMDCTNFANQGGNYGDNLLMYMGYYHTYYSDNITMVRAFRGPNYNSTGSWLTETWVGTPLTGITKVYQDYVIGVDADLDGNSIWILEAPDFYCAKFRFDVYYSDYWKSQVYDNKYFGTGSEESGNSGWTADVCDLSRDSTGNLHVLDLVDGEAIIKVFTGSSSGGTSLGTYGDPDTISYEPIKLDGSDFDGKMFVLEGNPTDGYFLSLFKPVEFPE